MGQVASLDHRSDGSTEGKEKRVHFSIGKNHAKVLWQERVDVEERGEEPRRLEQEKLMEEEKS